MFAWGRVVLIKNQLPKSIIMNSSRIFLSFVICVSALLSGCTIEKRQYRSGFNIDFHKIHTERKANQNWTANEKIDKSEAVVPISPSDDSKLNVVASVQDASTPVIFSNKWAFQHIMESENKAVTDSCDNIIMASGTNVKGKVVEITESEVKYKRCDNLNGPIITTAKHNVHSILYSNGTSESFVDVKKSSDQSNVTSSKRLDVLGLIGMILSVASIPFWWLISAIIGLVGGVIGIIFGSISIARIQRRPESRKGLGFAIASLVVGLLLVIATVIVWVLIL